jgi:hypothetical protein
MLHCYSFGVWKDLGSLFAAYPEASPRKLVGLIANGHARLVKPVVYAHQRLELQDDGRYVISMRDDVTPVRRKLIKALKRPTKISNDPAKVDYVRPSRAAPRFIPPAKPLGALDLLVMAAEQAARV